MKDTLPIAYNKAHPISCIRYFAQIQPYNWTSDTFGTCHAFVLMSIMLMRVKVMSSRWKTYGH